MREGLEPLANDVRGIAQELDALAGGSGDLRRQLDELTDDVSSTRLALLGSSALLDQYRASASEALALARESRDDLDADKTRSRLMAVVLGLTIALGQVVPAWVGRELLVTERARLEVVAGDRAGDRAVPSRVG